MNQTNEGEGHEMAATISETPGSKAKKKEEKKRRKIRGWEQESRATTIIIITRTEDENMRRRHRWETWRSNYMRGMKVDTLRRWNRRRQKTRRDDDTHWCMTVAGHTIKMAPPPPGSTCRVVGLAMAWCVERSSVSSHPKCRPVRNEMIWMVFPRPISSPTIPPTLHSPIQGGKIVLITIKK
jgi:hypothetical protein